MAAPYTIKNPNITSQQGNRNQGAQGLVIFESTADGNIQPGAKSINFYNAGDGAGGGSAATIVIVDPPPTIGGTMTLYSGGPAVNLPLLAGPGANITQEVAWISNGNNIQVVVSY